MGTVLSILSVVVSIFLVLVVLVQNSKGGGLSANFSSSNQIMGAPKTADFLEKITWVLAGTVIVLSLISAKYVTYASHTNQPNQISVPVDNTQAPDMQSPQPTAPAEQQAPALPQPMPAN
ncbi:MAG: preprotein translocase subunit SecG [Bacteroidota bacterium]|jgi:preprotein translocase subunit SecG